MTSTVSPFLIFPSFPPLRRLQDFRRQRNNLGEPSLAQLARHGPKDTRPLRVDPIGVQDDGGVVVETNVGAVLAAILLGDAHDHRLDDLALVDGAVGPRRLDGGHDHVADAPYSSARAAHDMDHQQLPAAGVVGDLQPRLVLDHPAASSVSAGSMISWASAATTASAARRRMASTA